MFKDYKEDGTYIPGHELPGKTLGDRVEEAMEAQQKQLAAETKGKFLRASSRSWNKDFRDRQMKQEMDWKIRSLIQPVYDAAEGVILQFVRSGAQVVGRFPRMRQYCFSLSGRGDQYMDYFEYVRTPPIMARLQSCALNWDAYMKERGGILRRLFFLLMSLLAYFVTLASDGVEQFARYTETVRGLLSSPLLERGACCAIFLLCLLPYVASDHCYRERRSQFSLWIPTGIQVYFLLTTLAYTVLRPDRPRSMNFMTEGILWGSWCFGIFLLIELWRLWKVLSGRTKYKWIYRRNRTELEQERRLIQFYQIWWKSTGKDYMHPSILNLQSLSEGLDEQYRLWS